MNSLMKKAVLAATLGATALTAAVPADAQRYGRGYGYGYRGYRNNGAGTAVVAGIAGLAIGAALASDRRDRYRDDYYRQGYYRDRGYPAYYDDGYYRDHGYYPNDGYYAYRYGDRGYGGCYVERRYDRYYGRSVRVRICR